MEIFDTYVEQEISDGKIEGLFLKLEELDKDSVKKRLNEARKKLSNAKRILKSFNKYEQYIKLINSHINESVSPIEILLKQDLDESSATELTEIYYEYQKAKEDFRYCKQHYKSVLKEFQDLIANNYEYSRTYNAIVEESKPLVESITNRFLNYFDLPDEDAIAVAYEGLTHAIINYNYNSGYHFSPYAKRVIKRRIARNFKELKGYYFRNHLMKQDIEEHLKISLEDEKTIYTASKIAEKYDKYSTYQISNLLKSLSKEYGFLDICELPDDSMTSIKGRPTSQFDYDYLDELEDKSEVIDEESIFEDDIISRLDQKTLKDILDQILKDFNKRDREIIKLYYSEQSETFRSIGAKFNISYTQVEKIIERAKKRLRTVSYQLKLKPFCDGFEFFDQKRYFDKKNRISKREFLTIFKRLYKLSMTNFSNEAKAVFCSRGNIKFEPREIEELTVLINTFLINMQLDKNNANSIDVILEEFYQVYSNNYAAKYPYADIYKMLQELREEDGNPTDIKTLLNKPHLERLMN